MKASKTGLLSLLLLITFGFTCLDASPRCCGSKPRPTVPTTPKPKGTKRAGQKAPRARQTQPSRPKPVTRR